MNRKYIFALPLALLWVFLAVPDLVARPMADGFPAGRRAAGAASSGAGRDTLQASAFSSRVQRGPRNFLNNEYYRESVRLTRLAQETYDYGDFDLAREYAEKAQENARLSDEYIALQLKIAEAGDAITAAEQRINWALGVRADRRYPREFAVAAASRDNAVSYFDAESWDAAIVSARQAIDALAFVEDEPGILLPAQYQVRPWSVSRDCFWNIAGRNWAYGDSLFWPRLYDANRSKLSDPGNPNLIHPGTVLDIPSIKGEEREGLWNETTEYPSFR
ncbi:MAG: LysM peptidoglycan-binding domain-containing protein [Spirochaetaceae bacterium]|jgi:nucleoid-associated protein YgaU|nr:LysM peptidoglycan-binding domain-containing protein [Spirochaetaceae bacterium]